MHIFKHAQREKKKRKENEKQRRPEKGVKETLSMAISVSTFAAAGRT